MLRRFYLFLLLCFTINQAVAIEAALGHAVFFLPDPIYNGNLNPYVEAFWQINPKSVHYKTLSEKGIIARIQTDVLITNDTGGVIKEDHYIFQTIPCKVQDLSTMNILELKRYFIAPGRIKLKLTLTDLNDSANKFTRTDTFTVKKVLKYPFYGTLEFIDTFYTSDAKSPFRKHGRQYIPLCDAFYDNYRKSLTYYSELYQIDNIAKADYPVFQSVFISRKENGDPIAQYIKVDTVTDFKSNNITGEFDISNLQSGNYYLNISLGTRGHRTITSKSVFFQRLNTEPVKQTVAARKAANDTMLDNINVLDLNKTFVAKYTTAQSKAILKMLLPVSDPTATRAIQGLLKAPDDLYVRYFIYNHFLARNKEKPEKAWKDYQEIVKTVNKLYSAHGRMGYETDKGFMYLRYGAPSEVVTVNSEKGALPYEIWQYDLTNDLAGKSVANALILFFKQSSTDFDYSVLHTTIPGELHNTAWRSFLFTGSDGDDYSNSKAEQMFGNR